MRLSGLRKTAPIGQSRFISLVFEQLLARFHRKATIIVFLCASLLVSVQAFAASEQVLYNFIPFSADGMFPNGGLIMDASGNLYGTTEQGGNNSFGTEVGTVFKVTSAGQESLLWSFGFTGGPDGALPQGGLIMDKSGNLYGTTAAGGLYDQGLGQTDSGGTVFEFSADGQESVLWNFGNGGDGSRPGAGLIMNASGNLFGTTEAGGTYGANRDSSGTAFELTSTGQESVLWSFGNGTDGVAPSTTLIMDASGNLYGTTLYGGTFGPPNPPFKGTGTLFKLSPSAAPAVDGSSALNTKASWTESILWNFGNGADGQNPDGVVMDANGNFFGTTIFGGTNNFGTVFEMTADGHESVLWNFGSGTDGKFPGGVIMDASGNLYGTTSEGGMVTSCDSFVQGCGTVFELSPPNPPGGSWTESILWNFGQSHDGFGPISPLLMDGIGNLFGTTGSGGANLGGTVFELSNLNSASGQISLSTQHIQFPKTSVGGSSSYQLAIRNTGTGQLSGAIATPPAPFGLQGSGSFNLAPHTQTKITLTFAPAAADSAHRLATITSTSVKQNSIQLDLRGLGTAPASPALALNEAPR